MAWEGECELSASQSEGEWSCRLAPFKRVVPAVAPRLPPPWSVAGSFGPRTLACSTAIDESLQLRLATRRRYSRFLEVVAAHTAQRIVVVCHYGFIHQLLHLAGAGQHHLQNCQWARAVWTC